MSEQNPNNFQHPYPTAQAAVEPKPNEVLRAGAAVGLFLVSLFTGGFWALVVSPNGFGLFMFLLFFIGGMYAANKVRKGE